jgi:single-strand DNA-binding protein
MINNVVLTGRLTKDPEIRFTPSGKAVASLTIAVNRTFTNGQGEREADFINLVAWEKTATVIGDHLEKGNLIGIEGRLQSRTYEGQDGQTIWVTEVVVNQVTFLEKKEEKQQQSKSAPNKKYSKK